jgi:hypothetical protein
LTKSEIVRRRDDAARQAGGTETDLRRPSAPWPTVNQVLEAIWSDWFSSHNKTTADGPSLERANSGFDTRTGNGGETIWVPLKG